MSSDTHPPLGTLVKLAAKNTPSMKAKRVKGITFQRESLQVYLMTIENKTVVRIITIIQYVSMDRSSWTLYYHSIDDPRY